MNSTPQNSTPLSKENTINIPKDNCGVFEIGESIDFNMKNKII